jgi:uncharacterized membrane protein
MADNVYSRIWSSISYLAPLFLVTLFVKRKDELAFFHAKQALGAWLVFTFGYVFSLLPGQFFAIVKWPICVSAYLLFAFLFIRGLIEAIRGGENFLPLIGEIVDEWHIFKKLQA